MTVELYGMRFSPYSEKARWALDHHGIAYRWHEHVPMMGELPLRMRAGSIGKKASVPLAIDGERVLRDSLEIARYADEVGQGAPLLADDPAVQAWDARSGRALGAGRVIVLRRSLEDREALRDSLPPWMPGFMRAVATPLAASGSRFVLRKYGGEATPYEDAVAAMRAELEGLRAGLAGRPTLMPMFSHADIAMAVVIQMISPVDDRYIRLGPGRRRAWTEPTLARDFADLVQWRDRLYAERRGERAAKAA